MLCTSELMIRKQDSCFCQEYDKSNGYAGVKTAEEVFLHLRKLPNLDIFKCQN